VTGSWVGLLAAMAVAVSVVGLSEPATAKVPSLSGCGGQLPPVTAPTWRQAQRQLVPSGATVAELCVANASGRAIEGVGINGTLLRQLSGEFDAVPATAGGQPPRCPAVPRVVTEFGYASGHVVFVSADLGGCALVTNGAVARRATGRYGQLIFDLETLAQSRANDFPALWPRLIRSRGAPRCSIATAPQSALSGAPSATVPLPGAPFGVASSPDGRWSFVALDGLRAPGSHVRTYAGIGVFSGTELAPRLVGTIGLADRHVAGDTLTHNGQYLLVTGATTVHVLDARRAERGLPHPELGSLSIPNEVVQSPIEVITSRDDHFAFVSLEVSDEIAVFDLRAALAHHFQRSDFVGTIPLGRSVVGMALSPNGKWLYATSERIAPGWQGALSVIDVHRAQTDPLHAVRVNVSAGCAPVRVAVSPDGRTVWVTARESNALLGFSTSQLLGRAAHALRAEVRVGQAPVGLAIVNDGREAVVADSDRFGVPGSNPGLTIVNTGAALNGQAAIEGYLSTGLFPREEAPAANGILLITEFGSQRLRAIDTTSLR
jgi:Lactonase, 7-bladed beta-propeller